MTIAEMTEEQLLAEIAACKIVLADCDYKQMKYFRGDLPEDEWPDVLATIHSRIDRINACEQELAERSES